MNEELDVDVIEARTLAYREHRDPSVLNVILDDVPLLVHEIKRLRTGANTLRRDAEDLVR